MKKERKVWAITLIVLGWLTPCLLYTSPNVAHYRAVLHPDQKFNKPTCKYKSYPQVNLKCSLQFWYFLQLSYLSFVTFQSRSCNQPETDNK